MFWTNCCAVSCIIDVDRGLETSCVLTRCFLDFVKGVRLVKFMWMYGLYAILPLMIPYMGMLRKSCSAM